MSEEKSVLEGLAVGPDEEKSNGSLAYGYWSDEGSVFFVA